MTPEDHRLARSAGGGAMGITVASKAQINSFGMIGDIFMTGNTLSPREARL